MPVEDCFELGRLAYGNGDYYHTIMWMEEALKNMNDSKEVSDQEALIMDYLAHSVYMVRQGKKYTI